MPNHDWTRDDTIIALDLYFRLPDEEVKESNPELVEAAKWIGAKPGSVRMKIQNFRGLDPQKQHLSGLRHHNQWDKEVWGEFNSDKEALRKARDLIVAKRERGER